MALRRLDRLLLAGSRSTRIVVCRRKKGYVIMAGTMPEVDHAVGVVPRPCRGRRPMRRHASLVVLTIVAAACAVPAQAQSLTAAPLVSPFSSAKPGSTPPNAWMPVKINDQKTPTAYDFVDDQGTVVLHAVADSAASLLGHRTNFDVAAAPVMSWRWKIAKLIDAADNSVAGKEDSPARIVLEFDGDKSKLSFGDRSALATGKLLSGREVAYATLMYVWSNKEPVGKVIPNPRTTRVQMVVASSGESGVGKWQTLTRNVVDDYRKAFGEAPGKMTGVAVLTDTDNTGERAEAWYGDISFRSQ
jgi:hypothetical protein